MLYLFAASSVYDDTVDIWRQTDSSLPGATSMDALRLSPQHVYRVTHRSTGVARSTTAQLLGFFDNISRI